MTAAARRSAPAVELRYRFRNAQPEPVELWLSLPPDGVGQTVEKVRLEPQEIIRRRGRDLAGVNELAYIVLGPGDQVELDATVRPERRRHEAPGDASTAGGPLSPEGRRHYLRATPMVPTDGAVAGEARRIVEAAQAAGDEARARALFAELALEYTYAYPPRRRGAAAMLEERAGDCGEFSFLFAAWCRSCGIPARAIVGTWARGRTQAHVWNEIHLDGIGWIGVDASMAALAHRKPWLVWLMGRRPGSWKRFFGALPGDRIAFSIDPDVGLSPPYAAVVSGGEADMEAAGRPLRWGRDTVGPGAPYLQPAYPRFAHPPDESPKERWNSQEPLGEWQVVPATAGGRLARGLQLGGTALLLVGGLGAQVIELGVVGSVSLIAGISAWIASSLLRRR
ncbi:MAG: transglutaminase domain-containing protein [Actinomycetota bacterium]|nr:transglutaminase domain-containing protein [Actinomycetota bacterium]